MDPFFSEEDEPRTILCTVAADSSTCSPLLQVPGLDGSSSIHLEALNQCVQNMVSDAFTSTAGYTKDLNLFSILTPGSATVNSSL